MITAIIIGAFMIHGLQPGPIMFVTNADIIYVLFLGLIVTSVALFFIGGATIRVFRFVADIPHGILFPLVLVLCVYGCFTVKSNIFDVGVMFAVGWLGFLMLRYGVPAAPFLIAFILGPLLEDNFRQAMLMSGGTLDILFRGPVTWFFWALTAITVFCHDQIWPASRPQAARHHGKRGVRDFMRGADLLIETLAGAGVRRIFSLSGNQIMPIYDACIDAGIDIVYTRNEATAVFMADAHHQLTGEIGVALVTAAPGAANALGPLYTSAH